MKITDFITFWITFKIQDDLLWKKEYVIYSNGIMSWRTFLAKDTTTKVKKLFELNDFVIMLSNTEKEDISNFIKRSIELLWNKVSFSKIMSEVEKKKPIKEVKTLIKEFWEINTYYYANKLVNIPNNLLEEYIEKLEKDKMIEVSRRKIVKIYWTEVDEEMEKFYKGFDNFFIKKEIKEGDKESETFPYSLYWEKNWKLELLFKNEITNPENFAKNIEDEVEEIKKYIESKGGDINSLSKNNYLDIYTFISSSDNLSKTYKTLLASPMSANTNKDYEKNIVEVTREILKDLVDKKYLS